MRDIEINDDNSDDQAEDDGVKLVSELNTLKELEKLKNSNFAQEDNS